MSKEKGCKCCKQIWYVDMLDKKLKLCPNCYEYCKPLFDDLKIKDKQIADLEAKLAESEKKAYSRGHSQRDIANEIKLNALREDVANKEKRIVELKQQLHYLPNKIVEKIRDDMSKRIIEKQIKWGDNIQIGFICNAINECLDTILEKFGEKDE